MAKKNMPGQFNNFKNYEDKINTSSDKELKLFEDFYQQIKGHALKHKQITLNNLHETEKSLSDLKKKADQLKDSVFYHEETVIVDRQAIISETEEKIHKENLNILHYEFNQAGERIDSLDYLNKALIQIKYNFFDKFKDFYTNQILDYNDLYVFYQEKAKQFDDIMNRYNKKILNDFQKLDDKITEMDNQISLLILQKNSKLNKINSFYLKEMKNYLDNDSTFSIEENLNSESTKSMISNKLKQLDLFKQHLAIQEEKVKNILQEEYQDLYEKTLFRLLKKKGNELYDEVDFFFHPIDFIQIFKKNIIEAEEKGFVTLKYLIKKYNNSLHYKTQIAKCEKHARNITKSLYKVKKQIYLEFQKESQDLILQLEKYYKLFIELLNIDPFLAQIIGDNSTKIIKDEINFLSFLQMNKEHQINVNFDIKTLKLKQQINEIESKLAYESEKLMLLQDIDILNTLRDIQLFFAENQGNSALIFNSLTKEKYNIEKLEKAVNYHMQHLVKESNLNRKFLSIITQILESFIRENETHNVRIVDAASEIKLALKKFDILALHYNTLYENEKRFLVLQYSRVSEETKINNEFILTTFENQMRFASEQISLANDEFKLRVEAIIRTFDEEKNYYLDIIKNQIKTYQDKKKIILDEYQAKLYYDSYMLQMIDNSKQKRSLEKQIARNKNINDDLIKVIDKQIRNDTVICDARKKLNDLNKHLEEALSEAEIIKQDTINEMTELYREAKDHFEVLKPYLENKVNILDPTFYKSLEKIKKKNSLRIQKAEKELDASTKKLIDEFRIIYFEEQPEINRELYLSQIEQFQEERDLLEKEYANNIEKNELMYQTKILKLEKDKKTILNNINNLKNSVINKSKKEIGQKQIELETLGKRYNINCEKQKSSFHNAILNLKKEYNQSIIQNEKYYSKLSLAFDEILKTYYPYLKVAKNNKIIKQIVKNSEKRMSYEKNKKIKELKRNSKSPNYFSQ